MRKHKILAACKRRGGGGRGYVLYEKSRGQHKPFDGMSMMSLTGDKLSNEHHLR